jgi:hypothetical protein
MDTIQITCIDNGKIKTADVLSKTDKYIKVVIQGTQIAIELVRSDVNRPYIGNKSGLEFTWNEKN